MIYVLSAGIIFGLLVLWYARWSIKGTRAASNVNDEFFRHAGALVDDDRTPDEAVDLLRTMANHIGMRSLVCRAFFLGLLRKIAGKKSSPEKTRQFSEMWDSLPDDVRRHLAGAAACFVLAVTFRTPILGVIIRRMIEMALQKEKDGRHSITKKGAIFAARMAA